MRMKRKRLVGYFVLLTLSLIFFIILSNFVGAVINVTSPRNYSNYSNWVLFNVTYTNGTDYADARNATFYYNLSGTWTIIGNASTCTLAPTGTGMGGCFVNLSIRNMNLTDGIYSINVTLANATTTGTGNEYKLYGASVIARNVIFDKTPPNVSFLGITNAINYGNYTSNLVINVSAIDVLMGISRVYFNITFPNGTQVNYTIAINSGNYYNITVDTTMFQDGRYNLTVYANDTLNNLNQTEWIYVTFDKTSPIGSLFCSPDNVKVDETVTCGCSGSDATSGISSYTSPSNPSTRQTGTFTESCTIIDYAGNSFTVTAGYTVEMFGGTKLVKPKTIVNQTGSQVAEARINKTQSWEKMTPGTVEIMKDFNSEIGIKQIQIEVKNEAQNVEISVIKYDSRPAAVYVSKEATYKYLQIEDKNLEQNLDKAIMRIQVEKSWTLTNNLERYGVALFRYNEETNEWKQLSTKFVEEDNTYYYYDVELKEFSYFAIAPKEKGSSWIWIVLSIVFVVLILFFFFKKKIKKSKVRKLFGLK